MIIRTGYLAKQFEFLQTDLRIPNVETIDDLKRENFSLYNSCAEMRLFWDTFFDGSYNNVNKFIHDDVDYNNPEYVKNLLYEGSKIFWLLTTFTSVS